TGPLGRLRAAGHAHHPRAGSRGRRPRRHPRRAGGAQERRPRRQRPHRPGAERLTRERRGARGPRRPDRRGDARSRIRRAAGRRHRRARRRGHQPGRRGVPQWSQSAGSAQGSADHHDRHDRRGADRMSDLQRADAVYDKLLERAGERWVQPRKERVARILTLLDDPQRTYRVVHITGTNGKTSTARMIESVLRAHGLRTGLFTSPHLKRFTERIMIDGEPIADAAVADAWDEIEPFLSIVDAELEATGDAPLTFFELLTVL